MILYLSIPLLIILFSKFINKKKLNFYDYFIIFLMVFICGFRYMVGTDYLLYVNMYNNLWVYPNTELVFKILINFCNNMGFSSIFFFFITSFFTLYVFYYSIKNNSCKPAESVFLFISLGYYAHCFNMIRQMMAIAIVLFGTKYIRERKLIKYCGLIFFAGFVHTSAYIMLPFYYISRFKFNKKTLKKLYILMIIGSFSYVPILNFVTDNFSRFQAYSIINSYTYSEAGIGTIVNLFFHCFLIALIIMYRDKLIEKNKFNELYINLAIFSLFFYFMSLNNTVAVRLAYYFSIYLIFILPDLFRVIFSRNYSKNMLVVIVCLLIYYVIHLLSFNNMLPYNNIFF